MLSLRPFIPGFKNTSARHLAPRPAREVAADALRQQADEALRPQATDLRETIPSAVRSKTIVGRMWDRAVNAVRRGGKHNAEAAAPVVEERAGIPISNGLVDRVADPVEETTGARLARLLAARETAPASAFTSAEEQQLVAALPHVHPDDRTAYVAALRTLGAYIPEPAQVTQDVVHTGTSVADLADSLEVLRGMQGVRPTGAGPVFPVRGTTTDHGVVPQRRRPGQPAGGSTPVDAMSLGEVDNAFAGIVEALRDVAGDVNGHIRPEHLMTRRRSEPAPVTTASGAPRLPQRDRDNPEHRFRLPAGSR